MQQVLHLLWKEEKHVMMSTVKLQWRYITLTPKMPFVRRFIGKGEDVLGIMIYTFIWHVGDRIGMPRVLN